MTLSSSRSSTAEADQAPASAAQFAALFKALSEPVRLRIIYVMLQRGELCVCDIVDSLELSQSVVSRHLAYLRNNGLVSTRRDGVWIYYELVQSSSFVAGLLELVDSLELSQSVVSRHLAYLRNNGLVSTRRDGVWIYYELVQSSSFVSSLLELFGRAGLSAQDLQEDLGRVIASEGSGCC